MMSTFMRCVCRILALYCFALPVTAAQTGETSKSVFSAWSQLGEVTMHYTDSMTNEQMFLRFIVHDNWDLLVEWHQPSVVKKLLQLQTSDSAVYYGLTEEELSSPAKSPFLFAGYGLAPAIGPLMKAFPEGIEQIPYSETSFSAIYENRSFKGTVTRTSTDTIKYNIVMDEREYERPFRCYGTFQSTKASNLPDDFSLVEWQLQSGNGAMKQSVRTLGELRKANNK
jgi:hypothetical protein